MQSGDKKAISGLILAGALDGISMTGPLAFPWVPQEVWQAIFWLMVTILALSGVYFVLLHTIRENLAMPLAFMIVGASLFVGGAIWLGMTSKIQTKAAKTPFIIEFADNANNIDTSPQSPFARFVNIGVDGGTINDFISKRAFLFEITNQRSESTDDISAFLVHVSYERGISQNVRVRLPAESGIKNLNPGEAEFFQFIEFLDEKWAGGLVGVQHIDSNAMNALKLSAKPGMQVEWPMEPQVLAAPKLGGFGIQKPMIGTVVYLDIAIYAANSNPTYARFSLTGDLKLHLVSQGAALAKLGSLKTLPNQSAPSR